MKQELVTDGALMLYRNSSKKADSRRESSKKAFENEEMPSERQEEWRYTYIQKFKLDSFAPFDGVSGISVNIPKESQDGGVVICDMNSAFEKHPSIVDQYLGKSIRESNKIIFLNDAFWSNGVFVYVPDNTTMEEPIRLNFKISQKSTASRNLIIVGKNCRLNIVEEWDDGTRDETFNSSVTEVFVGDGSKVSYGHLNDLGKGANSFNYIVGTLEKDSSIDWNAASFGGNLNRLRIDTIFNGPGSNANNLGVFLSKGKEHIDFTTNAYHLVPNTTNDIKADGILKDSSTCVYRGLIKIDRSTVHKFLLIRPSSEDGGKIAGKQHTCLGDRCQRSQGIPWSDDGSSG